MGSPFSPSGLTSAVFVLCMPMPLSLLRLLVALRKSSPLPAASPMWVDTHLDSVACCPYCPCALGGAQSPAVCVCCPCGPRGVTWLVPRV